MIVLAINWAPYPTGSEAGTRQDTAAQLLVGKYGSCPPDCRIVIGVIPGDVIDVLPTARVYGVAQLPRRSAFIRPLPYVRDLLDLAFTGVKDADDWITVCNADSILTSEFFEALRNCTADTFGVHRTEIADASKIPEGRCGPSHQDGIDAFGIRAGLWNCLREYFPDVILGERWWDPGAHIWARAIGLRHADMVYCGLFHVRHRGAWAGSQTLTAAEHYNTAQLMRGRSMSPKLTSDVPPDGRRNDTKDWWRSLQLYATNIFSQSGEDGVLARIFECIGATSYFCVEFGARDGQWLSNTKIFRDAGWSSLLMDCNAGPGVQKVFITAENVNFWFKRHGVPREIDLLSIDIDGNDLWIWKALKWKARVVVIEHNPRWPVSESKTIAYNPDHVFDNTQYHGASLAALAKVGREKGMEMVWHGNINAIFVQRDLLPEDFNRPLLHKPMSGFPADPLERPWEDY